MISIGNTFPLNVPLFAVSYDACAQKELLRAQGRRSKKRDEQQLAQGQAAADALASSLKGTIHWDKPLTEAQYG